MEIVWRTFGRVLEGAKQKLTDCMIKALRIETDINRGRKSMKEVFTVQGIEGSDGKVYNDFKSGLAFIIVDTDGKCGRMSSLRCLKRFKTFGKISRRSAP